jgi:hypothetical protein
VHYEFKHPSAPDFVRIEPIERGAPVNGHPATVSAEQIRTALAGVRLKTGAGTETAVFSNSELDEIAAPIAAALQNATATEDVTFAVLGQHGMLGAYSPPSATTARLFVEHGRLNVILGLAQASYEGAAIGRTSIPLKPGQRASRLEYHWSASADGARQVDKRGDWLELEVATLPRARAAQSVAREPADLVKPAVGGKQPPADGAQGGDARGYDDVAARLKTLDRLRSEGLISKEEYQERRRAILQSL